MLTVLMSVYKNDKPLFLKKALESIYEKQTLKPSEVVIVKDGPLTIELDMAIARWESKNQQSVYIKIIELDNNVGLGEALKIGLGACTYDIVARMDADDLSVPERFEKQYTFLLKHKDISLVGGSLEEFVDDENKPLGRRIPPLEHEHVLRYAKFRNPVNHATVMFRKKDVLDSGSYETMHGFEDYYLWIKLLMNNYKIENLKEVLLKARLGDGFTARRGGLLYAKREYKFLKNIHALGFVSKLALAKMLVTRMPIRMMPPFMLNAVYRLARKR